MQIARSVPRPNGDACTGSSPQEQPLIQTPPPLVPAVPPAFAPPVPAPLAPAVPLVPPLIVSDPACPAEPEEPASSPPLPAGGDRCAPPPDSPLQAAATKRWKAPTMASA